MTVSVVVPAYQASAHLGACLAALRSSTYPPREIIVVDDGSTDSTPGVAAQAHAKYVRIPDGPRGPAAARNVGARCAEADVLLFVDADVAVHADTIARIAGHLERHPDLAAVFGSYDDQPTDGGIISRYRNLLHHFVHQHSAQEASTFWAGCGAVRRETFLAAGGFDERYRRPSIEDIELGDRLWRAGHRIRLCPDVQVRHMKEWTLGRVLRTDVFARAIPWSRLMLAQRRVPRDLNTSLASRWGALAAWLIVLAAFGGIFAAEWLWLAAAGVLVLCALNAPLYSFFVRRGGAAFAAAAVVLHGLYLLYSSAVFGAVAAATWLARARASLSRVPN